MKEYTGINDKNGKKIYVGSKVKKRWGWQADTGDDIREHIVVKHTQDNRIEYRLGNYANIWTGDDVEIIR